MYDHPFEIVVSRETDGRFIAEVPAVPGALAYGHDRDDAVRRVQILTLQLLASELGREGGLLGWPFFRRPTAA